jgi:hypothetical protein
MLHFSLIYHTYIIPDDVCTWLALIVVDTANYLKHAMSVIVT